MQHYCTRSTFSFLKQYFNANLHRASGSHYFWSTKRLERNALSWFIFIIITAAEFSRGREQAAGYMHSPRLPRHPVSCLLCFCFSRACAKSLEIRHVTGKRSMAFTDAPCAHPEARHGNAWKKLLRMISMRPAVFRQILKIFTDLFDVSWISERARAGSFVCRRISIDVI